MSQHSGGGNKNSSNEDSSGNRTPGSPDNTAADKSDNAGNDINVDSIKEEKCIPPVSSGAGQLPPHNSPLDQMSKNREMDNAGKFVC